MKKKILFCIPNAGGASTLFFNFKDYLDQNIKMVPLSLPGRGTRFNETFLLTINDAVNDLYQIIIQELNLYNDCDYSIFGYSMGAVLAYEISIKIINELRKEPIHMFFAARYPPCVKKNLFSVENMSEENFEQLIKEWQGLPDEILQNDSLKEIFLRIIRNDLNLLSNYSVVQEKFKYNVNLTIFSGKYDKLISHDDLLIWSEYTDKNIEIIQFDEGHFFINSFRKEICHVINKVYH